MTPRLRGSALPFLRWFAAAGSVYAAAKLVWRAPDGLVLLGGALGALYGLAATGVILIHRTTRVVNFAAAGLGAAPAVTSIVLIARYGVPYPIALLVAVAGGLLVGAAVDLVVMRRFRTAPRLIAMVATIGVGQLLTYLAFWIPQWMGGRALPPDRVHTPFTRFTVTIGKVVLTGDHLTAVVVTAGLAGALATLLRVSRTGVALRASADDPERASLLAIPVARIGTVAWAAAGALASVTIVLRTPLVGIPLGGSVGPFVLLFALAAAVVAGMDRIPVAFAAGIAFGIVDQSSVYATARSNDAVPVLLGVILAALLLRREPATRARDAALSVWQAVVEPRPVPAYLRRLPEVARARVALWGGVAAVFLAAPWLVGPSFRGDATIVVIYAIVAVSLVVLTGWAGQVSLGQFGFVGIGAAVAGGLAANHGVDFFLTVIAAVAAGALVAVLLGLPALRLPGLYLAVVTLAFGAAVELYALRPDVAPWLLPRRRVFRPVLWERVDLSGDTAFYYLCLAFLVLVVASARSFRRYRSGRVLIASRTNPRAASTYAIAPARARLAAFALSGAYAAVAGALLAYQQGAIDAGAYGIVPGLDAFATTVVGGIGSVGGGVLGAVVFRSVVYLQDVHRLPALSLLATGAGLMAVLVALPGGLAEGLERLRERYLGWVAARRGLIEVVEAAQAPGRETVGVR